MIHRMRNVDYISQPLVAGAGSRPASRAGNNEGMGQLSPEIYSHGEPILDPGLMTRYPSAEQKPERPLLAGLPNGLASRATRLQGCVAASCVPAPLGAAMANDGTLSSFEKPVEHRGKIASMLVIAGLGAVTAGFLVGTATLSACALSSMIFAVGITSMAAGVAEALHRTPSAEAMRCLSNSVEGTIADPAHILNPANPANPMNMCGLL